MSFTLQLRFNNEISTPCASKVNLLTFKILKTNYPNYLWLCLVIIPGKHWRKSKTRKKRKYKCKTIREALYPANNCNKKTDATVGWVKINSQKEEAIKNIGLS